MTVSSSLRRAGPFAGDDAQTVFPFEFRVFSADDIVARLASAGLETTLTPGADYTVSANADQETDPGGSVTLAAPLAAGRALSLITALEYDQPLQITNAGGFFPKVIERELDRQVIQIQQLSEQLDRAVLVPVTESTDPAQLIQDLRDAAQQAVAAETAAEMSASAAELSMQDAQAAATAAQAAADSIGFRDVIFLSVAASPFSVTQAHSGKLLSVDTSGGNVTLNLPSIAGLALPFVAGVKKATADANTVMINCAGSDRFDDGNAAKVISNVSGTTLIPDTDPSPDSWTAVDFGQNTLVDNSVSTAKIQDGAVTAAKLASTVQASVNASATPGMVAYFAMSAAPTGWLECNGSAVSRTTYAALFAAIGTTFGSGNGSTTFNLPELRGEFLRGWDHSRGVDTGRSFGSAQSDDFKAHTHSIAFNGAGSGGSAGVQGTTTTPTATGSTGGAETRPRNIALLPCIRT